MWWNFEIQFACKIKRIKQCRWVLEMENEKWGHYDETYWLSSGSLRPDRH